MSHKVARTGSEARKPKQGPTPEGMKAAAELLDKFLRGEYDERAVDIRKHGSHTVII